MEGSLSLSIRYQSLSLLFNILSGSPFIFLFTPVQCSLRSLESRFKMQRSIHFSGRFANIRI